MFVFAVAQITVGSPSVQNKNKRQEKVYLHANLMHKFVVYKTRILMLFKLLIVLFIKHKLYRKYTEQFTCLFTFEMTVR